MKKDKLLPINLKKIKNKKSNTFYKNNPIKNNSLL